jgi:hypothetical protein
MMAFIVAILAVGITKIIATLPKAIVSRGIGR